MDTKYLVKLRKKYGKQKYYKKREYTNKELDSIVKEEVKLDLAAKKKSIENNEVLRRYK